MREYEAQGCSAQSALPDLAVATPFVGTATAAVARSCFTYLSNPNPKKIVAAMIALEKK